MRNKLFYLTKQSLFKKIKSKWFVVVNILLVILTIGLINIDSIINAFGGDFNETTEILVIDKTNQSYDILNKSIEETKSIFGDTSKYELTNYDKSINEAEEEIKTEKNKILIILEPNKENYMKATITSNSYIDAVLYQTLVTGINSTKETIAIASSNIDLEELQKISAPITIERVFLDEESNESGETMDMVMSTIFPIVILPFFMLTIFLIQMIGAEINDEKTTRGMEIIISNVSPKVHFFSKILAGNLFVFVQGGILLLAGWLGLVIRGKMGTTSILNSELFDFSSLITTLTTSGLLDKMNIIIPLTLILLILSFIGYSLIAGILASMTTNTEDYQQLQTPIILILLFGYYLAIMSSMFDGSIFIRIMSYVPFISSLLSPALLVMGQISVVDVLISIIIMSLTIAILVKYGLKIYKVGILNYSSANLWKKMFKAVKEK